MENEIEKTAVINLIAVIKENGSAWVADPVTILQKCAKYGYNLECEGNRLYLSKKKENYQINIFDIIENKL